MTRWAISSRLSNMSRTCSLFKPWPNSSALATTALRFPIVPRMTGNADCAGRFVPDSLRRTTDVGELIWLVYQSTLDLTMKTSILDRLCAEEAFHIIAMRPPGQGDDRFEAIQSHRSLPQDEYAQSLGRLGMLLEAGILKRFIVDYLDNAVSSLIPTRKMMLNLFAI